MQYNYDFEIAAFLLMTVILLHFLFIRQFPSDKTRIFRMLLFVCISESAFNIASSIGLANADIVPQGVNELLAFAFFILEGLCAYLIFRYVLALCEFPQKKKRRAELLGVIPFLAFEVFVLLTPFIGFFYYMEDGAYYQGFGADFGYFYIALFFVLNVVVVLIRREVVSLRTKLILAVYTIAAITAIVTQYYFREILLTSFGNLLFIFMAYLSMQNPSEMLDQVTGIGNESALMLQLKQILNHNTEVTVITVAIKQFHHMNTLFGLENCNALLAAIGMYLYNVGGRFHVFHNSGDTFTVLVEEPEKAGQITRLIQKRFADEWQIQQNCIVVDTVMVIQHYPRDFQTIPEYLGMREYLLEQAKRTGNQSIIETDESFIEKYQRVSQVEMAINNAIRNQTLQVYYQPIYSLKEKRIVSLEALVRLKDENLGFISPEEFIPLAEKNGSIIEIGGIVLEESAKFLAKHVLANVSLGIRTIQINMSVAQCMQQNLREKVMPVLEKYHIPPSMITLEITESTTINAPALMKHHMKELGELGITFAVDDYGSGNSNCSYLIRFPFREIKIDKEMTWAYFKNETAKIVLENEIITMKKLGIPLVVEGIEKLEQSEAMERLGVEYIQGYYYGKALPEKECLRYIRNFNSVPEEYGKVKTITI